MAMMLIISALVFLHCIAAADVPVHIPALFVLGDSTLDTGNLDFRPNTLHLIHADELPYGRDFNPPGPTGRASNGKLPPDLLAEYLGLPSPIDNLEPDAQGQRLLRGINFAASGSGILNGTGVTTVSLSQQMDSLYVSLGKISQMLGPQKTSELLASSVFLVSTGNNDMFNYNFNPTLRLRYQPADFNQMLLSQFSSDIQKLYHLGARRLVVLSVGPLGCTPVVLTSLNSRDGSCITSVNSQVLNFNSGLQAMIQQLKSTLPGINLLYANAYDILLSAIQHPEQYGFKYSNVACCGTGRYRGSPLDTCGPQTAICPVSDEHVFWDLVHPTQAMYTLITKDLFADLVRFL